MIGSKGLCVLDIRRESGAIKIDKQSDLSKYPTSCLRGFQCDVDEFQFKSKHDRWRMFQRTDEQSFTVSAMVWWEDFHGSEEDALVAIIKYSKDPDPSYYLVAWSSRR